MNEKKFTISVRQLYGSMGYKSDNFYTWWLAKAEKLSLVPGEDYAPTDNDWFVDLAAAEKLIRASRWGKRPLAVALLQSLRTGDALVVMSPPDAAARVTSAATSAPAEASPVDYWWSGVSNLCDPAEVGVIEQDSAANRRRYQIHRTPDNNTVESPWFRNENELESWLMVNGACKDERWNLEAILSSTASLVFIDRSNVGGKRIYRYMDGPLDETSGWLLHGAHLGEWLKGIGVRFAEPEPPPVGAPVVAAPEPYDPYAIGFQILQTDPEHEDVYYTEWGLEALDLEVAPPNCPYPLFPVNARALHTYMQIGIYFSKWIKGRIVEFKLDACVHFVVNPRSGENPQGERQSLEYWLTSDVAQRLAADVKSERGEQAVKFLDERLKRLEALEKVGQPAAPRLNQAASAWSDEIQALPPPTGVITPATEVVLDADTGELIPREIDGFVIHQRAKDGYVNATAMCKAAGKLIGHWSQNNDTKKVLASLSPVIGIPITGDSANGERGLVIIRQGGRPDEQGTWVHPTVALHLAQWCSSDFYAAVLTWTISEWASGNKHAAAPAFQIPTTLAGALRLAADTSEANEQLKLEVAQLVTDLDVKAEQVVFLEQTVESVKTSEERTVDLLMARLDVSDKAIPPTEFFKQTASILGLSSDEGFDYLVAAKIFSQPMKNKWGTNQYKPMAPHDKCGYFQPAYKTNKRSTYDEETGLLTDVVQTERLVTYHITADKLDKEGNITKLGGFRWLLEKATKSWRTLLNRMIAETGGVGGEFRKLVSAKTRRVKDYEIPCVDTYKEFCVIISKLPSGGVACAHKTRDGRVVRSEGATQREAFVKLNEQL